MSREMELASKWWEVERQSCGDRLRPYCLVILRNKKEGKSVVKASSSDFTSMDEYARQLGADLEALSNEEFVGKYRLGAVS